MANVAASSGTADAFDDLAASSVASEQPADERCLNSLLHGFAFCGPFVCSSSKAVDSVNAACVLCLSASWKCHCQEHNLLCRSPTQDELVGQVQTISLHSKHVVDAQSDPATASPTATLEAAKQQLIDHIGKLDCDTLKEGIRLYGERNKVYDLNSYKHAGFQRPMSSSFGSIVQRTC